MTPTKYPRSLFLLLSFIEGAAVMAAELIGAKMLAPFFGSSLYVWSTVLAITLGGLAAGYFTGGWLSSKRGGPKTLFICLVLAGILMALMPVTSKVIMYRIGYFPLIQATIMSSMVFLFPPIFIMGMVSPLIIGNITTDPAESGKYSGFVYGISTIGGIAATFLTGFWIIPTFGLSLPTMIIGGVLALIPGILLFRYHKWIPFAVLLVFAACFFRYKSYKPMSENIKVQYYQEGLLGQLAVADFPVRDKAGKSLNQTERYLTVNRVWQSQFNLDTNPTAIPEYDYLMEMFRCAQVQGKNTSVLTLGLGGGCLQNQLIDSGFQVTVCELDPRMVTVAKDYFHLRPKVNIVLDDARHFLRLNTKKYDAIFYDLFKGEHPPEHCFTKEAFQDVYKGLSRDGVYAINLWGYYTGNKGQGVRSICATLKAAGFNVYNFSTGIDEHYSNLVVLAFRKDCSPELIRKSIAAMKSRSVNVEIPGSIASVFSDERSALDKYNQEAYNDFRTAYVAYYYSLRPRGEEPPVFY